MANKILIVDDDPLMHLLYKNHLEGAGYQMIMAGNGIEALAVAARELPQLIVMDVMMVRMDGMTALRELKSAEATKGIPVHRNRSRCRSTGSHDRLRAVDIGYLRRHTAEEDARRLVEEAGSGGRERLADELVLRVQL